MLKSLCLENFTVFSSAQFEFSPGINVIIGENGRGKTHLLKAAYCLSRAWSDLMLGRASLSLKHSEVYFERRLMALFQPDHLESLIRWGSAQAQLSAEVIGLITSYTINAEHVGAPLSIQSINRLQDAHELLKEPVSWNVTIEKNDEIGVTMPESAATDSEVAKPIFIPNKEIVSFYEGLSGLLETYKIKLDATYRDMAVNLDFPELINPPKINVIGELESLLGGALKLEGRKLVFVQKDGRKLDTTLLAEGVCKLSVLPYFIRHGLIQMKGETLFWDEPEANLNPRLISKLAEALIVLAREGVQIILATHSLFLLKEIDLQLQLAAESNKKVDSRFFALSLGEDGVQISAGDNLVDVDPITALDMEIDLADRYQEWSYKNFSAE